MDEAARANIRRMAEAHTERAVNELVEPLTTALRTASADGDLSRYALVIGDDTSGRIPARMVWRVVCRARTAAEKPRAAFWFLPGGGGHDRLEGLAQRTLERNADGLRAAAAGSRALIVTDSVEHAGTVAQMAAGLERLGIPTDVVTAVLEPGWHRFHHDLPGGSRLYVGRESEQQPCVDGDHSISGVSKTMGVRALRSEHVTPYAHAARIKADRAAADIAATLGL